MENLTPGLLLATLLIFSFLITLHDRWLRQQFVLADKENVGLIDEKTLLALLKKLRTNAPQQMVKQKFQVS